MDKMTLMVYLLFMAFICQFNKSSAEFTPFVVFMSHTDPHPGRVNDCCSPYGIGVFPDESSYVAVRDQIQSRFDFNIPSFGRLKKDGTVWTRFTNENAEDTTVEEVYQSFCSSGIPSQLFDEYKRPPGVPLLCFGLYEDDETYIGSGLIEFKKECEWSPPCEPVEVDDNFVAFEFVNLTDLTPEQRFKQCCKEQNKYAASGSHFFFRTLEDRTKVFQQLQKVHTNVNFAMYAELDMFKEMFLNMAFRTGDGISADGGDCYVGAAAKRFASFIGLTYCVSIDNDLYTKVDTEEKMFELFGMATTTSELTSTLETSTITDKSITTVKTKNEKTPSEARPPVQVDKYCSSPACTNNPPSKCCSFCRPKN